VGAREISELRKSTRPTAADRFNDLEQQIGDVRQMLIDQGARLAGQIRALEGQLETMSLLQSAMADSMDVATMWVDPEGVITHVNVIARKQGIEAGGKYEHLAERGFDVRRMDRPGEELAFSDWPVTRALIGEVVHRERLLFNGAPIELTANPTPTAHGIWVTSWWTELTAGAE